MDDDRAGCVAILVVWVLSIPLDALALSLSWNWFVVPLLNVPALGMMAAVGIRIFLSAIIRPPPLSNKSNDDKSTAEYVGEAIGGAVLYPLITIAMAFGWHLITG